MTQKELEKNGYKMVKASWARGYVSRRSTDETREAVEYSGRINAQYYVLIPSRKSTNYCIKLYYAKA